MQVLDLGRVPLANALLTAEQLHEPEDRFPLELYFCPQCALVQIGETVPPERLFRDYAYASSFSDTMVEHARTLVETLIARRGLGPASLVIEVASNDGYLLQFYKQRGIPVLGIEPAANIAELAIKTKGIPTLVEFFDEELARRLAAEGKLADVIHAHNVFAHVPDPNRFVGGVKRAAQARRRCRRRGALRPRSHRQARVRHHLSRALQLLLRERGRGALPAAWPRR